MDSNEYARRSAQVKSTIRAAFPIIPIPGSHSRDDGIANYEVDEDVQKFNGHMWTEISLDHWIRSISPSAIRRATSSSFFKYYLPSLLVGVLHDSDYLYLALDALLPDNPRYEPRPDWKEYRMSFDAQQADAVVSFLELAKESVSPESAGWHAADAGLGGLWN